jgi:hypothetical protein
MGNETGTFSYADFAYNSDSLFFICQVFRSQARSEEPYPDGINFYVESKGASTDKPLSTAYRFNILPNGTLSMSKGDGTDWTQIENPDILAASSVTSSYYRIELGIPWTSIGLETAPVGQNLSVNLEVMTGDGTQQLVERIQDASPLKPATWVLLNLIEPQDPTGIEAIRNEKSPFKGDLEGLYDLQGRQMVNDKLPSGRYSKGIFVQNGRKCLTR